MTTKQEGSLHRRSLARTLAQEIKLARNPQKCFCEPDQQTITITGGGSDVTNVGGDGD